MSLHHQIISYKEIEKNLIRIFPDCIIADTSFTILDVSDHILNILSYKREELVGKNMNVLLADPTFRVLSSLNNDFYVHMECELKDKFRKSVEVYMSAYFLGLISDINGKVIIHIKSKKEQELLRRLEEKSREMENFIYRISHDVRGPIASIKGLVNLFRMSPGSIDSNLYIQLIEESAERLDSIIEYLNEVVYEESAGFEEMFISDIASGIHRKIKKLSKLYAFQIMLQDQTLGSVIKIKNHANLIFALIENFLFTFKSYKYVSINGVVITMAEKDKQLLVRIGLKDVNKENVQEILENTDLKRGSESKYYYLSMFFMNKCREKTNARVEVIAREQNCDIEIVFPSME